MSDFQYQIDAQVQAIKTALAITIQALPEEQKETILNLLQMCSEYDYTKELQLKPDEITEVTIEKIDSAFKSVYQDIISQASPDVFDGRPQTLQ